MTTRTPLLLSLCLLLPALGPAQQYVISTVAGDATQGYSADNVPATTSELNQPRGVAVDGAGNFYIADTLNNRVRKVDKTGTITTFAGMGPTAFQVNKGTYNGDGIPATNADVNTPVRLTTDANGNVYIADTENHRVRRVDTKGVITTVAGNGNAGYNGDNIPATSAWLNTPEGVAVDAQGNIYIADSGNNLIRKVDTNGTITTFAGVPRSSGYNGDNIPATSAKLNLPTTVALDAAGDLYLVDQGNQVVRKITNGTITTIAGVPGSHGFNGDGIPATTALLYSPAGVAVDAAGNVYIADASNNKIRKVSTDGTISTIAGNGSANYLGDGVLSTATAINAPRDVAITPSGEIYIADTGNSRIRFLAPATAITSVVNSASNVAGAIAPGEIVTIFGSQLGPSKLVVNGPDASGVYPTQAGGTNVSVNGTAAPMIYASAAQAAFVVPYETTGATAQVIVEYQGTTSLAVSVPVAPSSPALFTVGSGTGEAAVVNQDGSINSATNPAVVGSIVVMFATGEGQTSPAGVDGQVTGTVLPKPVLPVSVMVGGKTASVLYAGEAPGEIAGVMQLNVEIPTAVQPGSAVPVVVQVGTASSPAGVTLAVKAK